MVSVPIDHGNGKKTIRMEYTDQKLTAYAGTVLWSGFLQKIGFLPQVEKWLPHHPVAHNALRPREVVMGFLSGILLGADKLARVAWLSCDLALAEVLGIMRMPSQSTLSRFFQAFTQSAAEKLQELYPWMLRRLPSQREGYTLDLDSVSLMHEDGHQEGVKVGYSRKGFKPCHHPLIGVLAEVKMVVGYWLRSGNCLDAGNAVELIKPVFERLPQQIRIKLVRADSGFVDHKLFELLNKKGIRYVVAHPLGDKVKTICRHDDSAWESTDLQGLDVQEVPWHQPGQRLIVIRHRIKDRPEAGGKMLFDLPGYRYQALITDLPAYYGPLKVWQTYNGRADCENRIKELGAQFGLRTICCKRFWATEAAHQLAIAAYNLCVLFQRELGIPKKMELRTLRFHFFCRAGTWSQAQNTPTLRLALKDKWRDWWDKIIHRLISEIPVGLVCCDAAQRLPR